MKPISKLNNVQRATILFDLFPGRFQPFYEQVEKIADGFLTKADEIKLTWENKAFTFEFWYHLAKTSKQIVTEHKRLPKIKSRAMIKDLFDQYNAFFSIHCLYQLPDQKLCKRFSLATKFLFDFE